MIKRAGEPDAVFAEVGIFAGDTVARLAERAFAKFHWPGSVDRVKLFLVPDGLVRAIQHDPAREADVFVATNRCLATDLLPEAGIRDRSCLLVRLLHPQATLGEFAPAPFMLIEPGGGGDSFEVGSVGRSPLQCKFPSPFQAAAVAAVAVLAWQSFKPP